MRRAYVAKETFIYEEEPILKGTLWVENWETNNHSSLFDLISCERSLAFSKPALRRYFSEVEYIE